MADQPTFIEVQKYLKGVDYPCTLQQLIDAATENGAPDEVLDALGSLPDREYDGPTGVSEEIGNS